MNCRGQALAEFALAMGVLVTLLAGLPLIGRYHELQLATIEGARRLAFESAWLGAGASRPGIEATRAALFPAVSGSDQPVAERFGVRYARSATPALAGQATRALLAPFTAVARTVPGFDLRDSGLSHAELTVALSRPAELPEPFAAIPIELHGSYALLGDGWGSFGPGQVARRAGSLVFTHAAHSLHALTALGSGLLSIIEPAFRQFCLGYIDPERVPADRVSVLIDRDAGPVTSWTPPC